MKRRTLIRGGAGIVALGAIGGGGYVGWKRQQGARLSEEISEEWPEIGIGFWLIPNLDDAYVVVPDRPHSHQEAMDTDLRAKITRTREFLVNSNGLRMRNGPVSLEPTPGVFRLACLGDSVTFGWGVEDDEAWPAVLERQFAEQGIAIECLNLGVPAQGIAAMSRYLQIKGPELGLDGIVICERLSHGDTAKSYAAHVLQARFAMPKVPVMVVLPPISRFDINARRDPLREYRDLGPVLRDIPLIDLTQTIWDAQGDEGHDLSFNGPRIQVLARKDGEVVLDETYDQEVRTLPDSVYQLFEQNRDVYEPLMFDGGHPDAKGFIPFARAVGDAMIAEGWFG